MVEEIVEQPIAGVYVVRLKEFPDERGRFVETFRRTWIPGAREMVQANRSDSRSGTLRGMHYHLFQADYWYLVSGQAKAGLFDLRESSKSFKTSMMVDLEGVGLYIPPGVAHGFYAMTDVTLTYLVDQVYDGTDELGFRWDDPVIGLDWPSGERIVSERDQANPLFVDIATENLPE